MFGKLALREKILKKLKSQPVSRRRARSLKIYKKLFKLGAFEKAKNVCFYMSLPEEVNTKPMIRQALKTGRRVFLPRVEKGTFRLGFGEVKNMSRDLEEGFFGIWQPKRRTGRTGSPAVFDAVIIPGLLFDRQNHRLGRGQGYYDRFLEHLPARVLKVGLGFSFQRVAKLPREKHDQKLDVILTD